MRIRFLFLALLALSFSFRLNAQTIAQLVKAGDERFAAGDYYPASLYYKQALKSAGDDLDLTYKFAEASRLFNDYAAAATAYETVTKLDKENHYPLAVFWQAEMLRCAGIDNTTGVMKLLKKFKSRYHKKDFYAAKAEQESEACAWVLDHTKPVDSVKIEHLGKDVNTENSEFNATYVSNDKIQFSSLRNISDDKKNAKYLVRIYNQPPTPNAIYMPEGANAALNVGNIAYSPNATKLYYTQCEQKDKVSTRCDIYVSKYENYKWSTAQILPAPVNNHSFTNTHPCIAYDAQGNELLIFSSDRSGGYGGMDLWFCRVEKDGTYSDPQNMGAKINTRGNEVTPFFDFNKKKLYYSSDWLYGFGGYDIFETREQNGYWLEPVNLLQPVNTAQNDLYYSVAPDNSKAYITSNRVGSYFIEAATCCNDIYAYGSGKKIEPKLDTPAVAIKDTTPVTQLPPVAQVETTPAKPDEPVGPVPVPPAPATTTTDKLKKINQTLPVLYFDNDEPDARTLSDTTKLDYKQTYEAYASKIFEYEREFSKGMKGNAKAEAKNTVDSLFTNKVDKGFYDLIAFSSQLLDLLKSGNKIEVTIKGYCSPLNYSAYNMKLGYRRVASLENYLYHYQAGILLPYISSGQLVLKRISFGKETAPKDISDNLNDTRNSVYNPRAALERRVEVLSVELK